MRTKERQKSYLYISNGEGPAPDPSFVDRASKAAGMVTIISPGKEREWNTVTCNHCQQTFLFNSLRRRSREWCWTCDHYICDRCAAVRAIAGCKTFAQILNDQERLVLKTGKVGT